MKKQLLFCVVLLATLCLIISSCSSEDDEPIDIKNWQNVNLNDVKNYYGIRFDCEKVINEDGTTSSVLYDFLAYQINDNNTITVYKNLYRTTYPFTFQNGTFTFIRSGYGSIDPVTLKFDHLNEYRLKLNVKEENGLTNKVKEDTYKVIPVE